MKVFGKVPAKERGFWGVVPIAIFALLILQQRASYSGFTPMLTGQVDALNISPRDGGSTNVIVVASIKNAGAPSIADHFMFTVTLTNGTKLNGSLKALPRVVELQSEGGRSSVTMYGKDDLSAKATDQPIATGGMKRGILYFVVPAERAGLIRSAKQWELSFTDVNDKKYSAVHKDGPMINQAGQIYPGLDMEWRSVSPEGNTPKPPEFQ